MKQILLAIFVIMSTNSFASKMEFPVKGTRVIPANELMTISTPEQPLLTTQTINQFDSVFFDIAQAVVTGNSVEFSVYLKSDDVINALDFAFKYNQTHLEYDTIINLTSYIDPLAYYNPNDSTVRLTSYSFTQPYVNDTPLFLVRFNLISGQLCSNDLDSVSALLNGDAAAYYVSGCVTGIFENPEVVQLNIFPNPAADFITFELKEKATVEIVDIQSKLVMQQTMFDSPGIHTLSTEKINNGIYFLKVTGNETESFSKFIINR